LFVRAGVLGLPLMVAIIGGDPRQFKPLITLYREAGARAGHPPEQLQVGLHSIGFVADTMEAAADGFSPGYSKAFSKIGRERGWPPTTRAQYDAARGRNGALLIGDPETVVDKILRTNDDLGGIARVNFQMTVATVAHDEMMRAIELLGTRVAPLVRERLKVPTSA